jgi:NADH dehydrogenase/NADH:ubiquinone oxidoreductase subunit G
LSFVRVAELARPAIGISVNGAPVRALAGDTLLTALRLAGLPLRASEFGDGPRGGFCLMGACQDCWLSVEGAGRVRACQTPASEGMRVRTDG